MSEFKHKSVLFEEAVESLCVKENGVYIDGTAGGGGHTSAILEKLGDGGLLIAIDQDPDAIKVLTEKFKNNKNVKIVKNNFSNLNTILDEAGVEGFDGLLLDIGVSSYQLDTAERGFSFHQDAPLDMRMAKEGISARDVVNEYDEKTLANIIFKYGEEKYSRSIAKNIVIAREEKPIETTFELVDIIKKSMPAAAMRNAHPARRTFQAIRIEVNKELDVLSRALDEALERANANAKISVITFHSLEDRLVKLKFKEWAQGCECPKDFPVCVCGKKPKVKILKAKKPSENELLENPRSRSARLRTAEKI